MGNFITRGRHLRPLYVHVYTFGSSFLSSFLHKVLLNKINFKCLLSIHKLGPIREYIGVMTIKYYDTIPRTGDSPSVAFYFRFKDTSF